MNFCDYLNHESIKPRAETLLAAAGKQFKCPLKAGNYEVDTAKLPINLENVQLSPLFQRLGSGMYQIEFRVLQANGKPLACLRVTTKVNLNLKDVKQKNEK